MKKQRLHSNKSFDLTTKKGIEYASHILTPYFPLLDLLRFATEKFMNRHETMIVQQKKVAEDLIKKGKEEGVDEMSITMNNKSGLSLKSKIDIDCDIDCTLGNDDTLTLHIKYK